MNVGHSQMKLSIFVKTDWSETLFKLSFVMVLILNTAVTFIIYAIAVHIDAVQSTKYQKENSLFLYGRFNFMKLCCSIVRLFYY